MAVILSRLFLFGLIIASCDYFTFSSASEETNVFSQQVTTRRKRAASSTQPPSPTATPPTADPPSPTANPPSPTADPPSPTADPPSPTADPPSPTADPPSPTADPPSPTADPPSPTADPPTCSDSKTKKYLLFNNPGERRNCKWLTKNKKNAAKRIKTYCSHQEVKTRCPLTCSFCECVDDATFTFELGNGQTKNCAYLRRNKKKRKERIDTFCVSTFNDGLVADYCTKSCKKCRGL